VIVAHVTFGVRSKNAEEQSDLAESYLASLLHAGQLCGEYFLTWTKGRLNAHVLLAGPGAFELRHHSIWGKKELNKVADAFGSKPTWRILDDDAGRRPWTWKGAPFLYLFTHAFDWASPVCRGDGKAQIPVFFLPISFEQKEDLYSWQRSYYHHDHIWLGSGALEVGAYRELAGPNSELAQQGRKLCRELESSTGVPTFYYLMRYWGRPKGEEKRRCPGCGARWSIKRATKKPERFLEFDFRCEPCRLVSHLGVSTDGGRRTRIGEYQEQSKKGNEPVQRTRASRFRST
jgi:predicted  nucleic acid-binding Zn ribbon protein